MRLRALLLSILVLTINACSYIPWFGDDEEVVIELREPTELIEFEPQVKFQRNWQVSLGGDTEDTHILLYPHVFSGNIAFTETGGKLSIYDISTGHLVNSVSAFNSVAAGVGGNEHSIVVGTLDGDVAAFNTLDLAQLWSVNIGSEVVSIAHVQNEQVIIRGNDNRIVALSMDSGELLWTVEQTSPALTLRGANKPLVADGIVYAGMDNGEVIAIAADSGNVIWEARVSVPSGRSELDRLVDIDGKLAIDDEFIYASSYHGRVVAINRINGRINWARDIASIAGVSADDIHVYVTDRDDNIWALEKSTGVSVWKQEKLLYRQMSAPIVLNSGILIGGGLGYLHALSKQDGSIIGRVKLGKKPVHLSSMSRNDIAYVTDTNGRLASYSIVRAN